MENLHAPKQSRSFLYNQSCQVRERKGTDMKRKQFIETILSETISIASGRGERGWVDHLEFDEQTEEVTIVCRNGHKYYVNVFADSHLAIIQDVMKEVMRH